MTLCNAVKFTTQVARENKEVDLLILTRPAAVLLQDLVNKDCSLKYVLSDAVYL